MPITQRYLIVKEKDSKEITYFEYDKLKGYNITPKKNVTFKDCINVNRMILINPTLIEKLVDKKVKKRFYNLIEFLSEVYENDEGDGTNGPALREALDELERFKREVNNKYREYMKEEEIKLLGRKLAILENEIKLRFLMLPNVKEENYGGKSR